MTHPLDIALAQRDAARRLAVALEQQVALCERNVAELMGALDEALRGSDPWPEAAAAQAAINARGTTHIPTDPPF